MARWLLNLHIDCALCEFRPPSDPPTGIIPRQIYGLISCRNTLSMIVASSLDGQTSQVDVRRLARLLSNMLISMQRLLAAALPLFYCFIAPLLIIHAWNEVT